MIREIQVSLTSRRERLRYGFGAVFIGIAALLFLLSFRGGAAQGLAAPAAPAIPVMSSETSLDTTYNTIGQAVAGELVTVTAVFAVPEGDVIYNASPRVVLQDGLYPIGASQSYTLYTGTVNELRLIEGSGNIVWYTGALLVFPNQGTITGPDEFTMTVYAVRRQQNYVGTPNDINNNYGLRVEGILRYCTGDPSCSPTLYVNTPNTSVGQVVAIQPLINTTYASSYLDAAALGAGGEQVRLTFIATAASSRPAAYDIVYTATLDSGLTYVASNGAGVGTGNVTTVGETTYVTWTVPGSLITPQSWQAVVTATLPSTFTVGQEFVYRGTAAYETFAGDVTDEGKYFTDGAPQTLRPGVSITSKTSVPSSGYVTMGDRITYTLTFRQADNTLLQAPYYVDTLPRGFHYVTGTLAVQGASLLSHEVLEGPSANTTTGVRYFENLRVNMDTLPVTDTVRQVTVSYVALNTGLDYYGNPVWDLAADMISTRGTNESNTVTGAMLYWTPPEGFAYSNLGGVYTDLNRKANSATNVPVIQPFLANQEFASVRNSTAPVTVGDDVLLIIRLRNSGATAPGIPAHELQVCDVIPEGFEYRSDQGCAAVGGAPACPAYDPPAPNSTGKVCWTIYGLPRTDLVTRYYEFTYQVRVLPTAVPGLYTSAVSVEGYSTKLGSVEGERDYSTLPQALTSGNCGEECITVLGLAADKQPWATHVAPGDLLTYTLWLTDTRGTTAYTGAIVTDTYDSLLSFVGATPSYASHDSNARRIVWNLGDLSVGGNKQITLTMRVASEVAGRFILTNTMAWDSDQSEPFTIAKTTAIDVSALHLNIDGPQFTHAGGGVVYAIDYSNTGSWNNAPVTLTLDYGPYLTYVNSSLTPEAGSQNRVFVDTVLNDGVSETLMITLTTNAPLPYTLEEITSTVELASPGAPSQTDDWTTILQRPVFTFRKMGPPAAAAVNGTMQYTFELVNTGDYTATGLLITDTWDTATSFQTSPGWTPGGGGTYATYAISSLAPGATATVNPLTVRVDTSKDSYLNQAELSTAQTSVQTTSLRTWSPSIELSKSAYPDPAFPGRVLTYTLVYSNVGGFTIGNAVITDTLPDGFNYQPGWHTVAGSGCQAPGWQFSIAGQVATWTCTILDLNASGDLQIWGLIDEGVVAEGTWLENMAESDGAAPVPYRPMDEPLRTLVARPWLRVNKVGAPTHPVAPGDFITYTLTYENYGSYAAYDVVVKDELPTQLTFAGCDPACTHNAGLVSWTVGEVPVDGTGEVVVYATVNAGTAGQTAENVNYTVENTTIWQQLLPSETDHGDPVNTTILDPELTLMKAVDPTVVQMVNETIVYTITYANTGGGLLHNVVITDVLDTYTAFTSASAGCAHTGEASGGTVTCQLGGMLNGESREIVIHVRVLPGLTAGDTIPNQAQGRTDEAPLTSSNTTTVWYQVAAHPVIVWTPTSFTKSAEEGSTTELQDTLTLSNTGTANLLWNAQVMTPTEATWLRIAVGSGDPGTSILPQVTAPGASTDVTVYFDPTGLSAGVYTGWLRIESNDADEGPVLVEVTFTIEGGYNIYLPLVLKNYQ